MDLKTVILSEVSLEGDKYLLYHVYMESRKQWHKSTYIILKVTFHLQLLQNIGWVPHNTPVSLSYTQHFVPPTPPPIGHHGFILYIRETSFLLYSLVCCIFWIPHVGDTT